MPRHFLAASLAASLVAANRADAFWWYHSCGPIAYFPQPMLVFPMSHLPVATVPDCGPCGPILTTPDGPSSIPTPSEVGPTSPPRVQEMPPSANSKDNDPLPPKDTEPAPETREVTPRPAVPRPAVPPPEQHDTPRPKDKTSDGLPIPKPNLPTTPPASDPQYPPLKLNPPPDDESSVSFARPFTEAKAEIYPVESQRIEQRMTAGLHNRTERSITITIQGETIVLPSQHSISARIQEGFTWRLDGGPEQDVAVPAGSAGVEIVIR